MSSFSGDFLGFTLGDIHSSTLNITRVSNSDRYEDNLLPTLKDFTLEVPGGDGTYYFNSFYTQKTFTIDFAYDGLHDEDLRALRQILGFKGIQPLIFDEFAYKKYMVKCAAPPTLKYICFDYNGARIYKGEGTLNLVAYYPYAISVVPVIITNVSSSFLSNEGDIETSLKVYYNANQIANLQEITLQDSQKQTVSQIGFSNLYSIDNDKYILVDFSTHLIEGLNEFQQKTGHLYNQFITTGDFFNLPPGQFYFNSTISAKSIEYNMLYY